MNSSACCGRIGERLCGSACKPTRSTFPALDSERGCSALHAGNAKATLTASDHSAMRAENVTNGGSAEGRTRFSLKRAAYGRTLGDCVPQVARCEGIADQLHLGVR